MQVTDHIFVVDAGRSAAVEEELHSLRVCTTFDHGHHEHSLSSLHSKEREGETIIVADWGTRKQRSCKGHYCALTVLSPPHAPYTQFKIETQVRYHIIFIGAFGVDTLSGAAVQEVSNGLYARSRTHSQHQHSLSVLHERGREVR
jgi:hypothetical protein